MPVPMALVMVLLAAPAGAQDAARPDTCVSGFVWREAFPGDHVCVTPEVRAQTAEDNRVAPQRRAPGGGPYGPDTCRPGFVWREARPEDHVCVTPETRSQAAADNQSAPGRHVRPRGLVGAATRVRDISVLRPDRVPPPGLSQPPPRSGSPVRRGFDENGEPYIEETLSDGSVRREQQNGVTIIAPDGTKRFFPAMTARSHAQPPIPPELPSDPTRGRAWVTLHNDQLLGLIRALVNNDDAQMQTFSSKESQFAGPDLFKQVEYRTRVLQFLARP